MVKEEAYIIELARRYAHELENLGISVKEIILYGSYARGEAKELSDIDFAVVSDRFGKEDCIEFSGILSKAKHPFYKDLIQAIGLSPTELRRALKYSFVEDIKKNGKVVYKKAA